MEVDEYALGTLEMTPELVRAMFDGLPGEMAELPVDQEWSAKHVLAHLLDIDDIFTGEQGRIRRIVTEQRPFIRSIDPTARLHDGRFLDRPIPDLLAALAERRRAGLAYVRTLSAADLARVGDHDEAGEISASNLLWQWAYHDLMHVEQLCSILKAPFLAHMGNTRRFYFDG